MTTRTLRLLRSTGTSRTAVDAARYRLYPESV